MLIKMISSKTAFYFIVLVSFCSCNSSKHAGRNAVSGIYLSSDQKEKMILSADGKLLLLRKAVLQNDVYNPICDTLAQGLWDLKASFILLRNKPRDPISFSIKEEISGSPDSIYFGVKLPGEIVNYNMFGYQVVGSCFLETVHISNTPNFALKKSPLWPGYFGFTINNYFPIADPERKSYQAVAFEIFNGYHAVNLGANKFTIVLTGFTQCYYEAMDIDGEILGMRDLKLYWRGKQYTK